MGGRQPFKNLSDIICLGRPYLFKFFKGCLPQILTSRDVFMTLRNICIGDFLQKHPLTISAVSSVKVVEDSL